jgi:hypothetical protein
MADIPIYQAPGVGRFAEIEGNELPQLTPALNIPDGKYAAAVMEKQGDWLRVVYDDAGREGWIHKERYWEFVGWEIFLKGRMVRLLPGLKTSFYSLRNGPSATSPTLDTLSRQRTLRVIEVKDDWCLVMDEDGRFLIAVDEKFDPQKH